jgi:hypothetical protein
MTPPSRTRPPSVLRSQPGIGTGRRGRGDAAGQFGLAPTLAQMSFGELVQQVDGKNELVARMRTAKNEGASE